MAENAPNEPQTQTEAVGRCYDNAADLISALFLKGTGEGWTLVHGRPTLRRPPFEKYGHAWLEYRGLVIDTQFAHLNRYPLAMPRAEYYRAEKIDPAECYRYSAGEAVAMMVALGHYGPWEGVEAEGL